MNRDDLFRRLRAARPALEAEGVAHLALFGSRARGDHRPDSDIDLLVEPSADTQFSILDLIGAQHVVEDITGLRANALMRRSLDARFREAIAPEVVEIF